MFEIFVLVQTKVGKAFQVTEQIRSIPGIKSTYTVTGPYDIIASMEIESIESLEDIIKRIHAIDGVERTLTAMVIKKY
ncbi:AsnC family transcriptional regulator [Thermocladium modestius]|uniref:AsnC family transcriptional regulator n=1 Tax=Thermocladium modestius TaxID=62609 RepID=A0A830GU65_9CREN|nr:Lrp/AsnC ligand binding domain-containing protein [Thermocladium modestius]GGP20692.1 AsnC family transcriptional regulator [Thermocladium modestius]